MSWDLWQAHAVFALGGFLILPLAKLPVAGKLTALLLILGVSFVPVSGLPLAVYPRSLLDDLALTTLAWLGYAVLTRFSAIPRIPQGHRVQILVCFALATLVFYPATLGMTYFDPYRLGFAPRELLSAVLVVTLVFWMRRNYLGAALLTIATLGFIVDIKASNNYWDYLIDPVLGLYCWLALLHFGVCATVARLGTGAANRPG
jgi:hypothetical protein